jgi:hypothetical protein
MRCSRMKVSAAALRPRRRAVVVSLGARAPSPASRRRAQVECHKLPVALNARLAGEGAALAVGQPPLHWDRGRPRPQVAAGSKLSVISFRLRSMHALRARALPSQSVSHRFTGTAGALAVGQPPLHWDRGRPRPQVAAGSKLSVISFRLRSTHALRARAPAVPVKAYCLSLNGPCGEIA